MKPKSGFCEKPHPSLHRFGNAAVLAVGAWLWMSAPWAGAQSSPTFNIEVVGQVGGGCHGVQVQGDYAYIGEGPNFTVLDVTVTSGPEAVIRRRFHGTIGDVYVDGNTAYAAGWAVGLVVMDITDPTSPVIMGTYETGAYKVVVYEGHAYVPRIWGGVEIIDVSDPYNPTQTVGIDYTGFVENVWVADDKAYLSAGLLGIHVLDVSNPSAPAYLGTHAQAPGALDVQTSGSLGYVAGDDLYVVDFDLASTSSLLGTHEIDGSGLAVHLEDELVYVATSSGTVHIVDVSSPTAPVEVGSWTGTILPIDLYVVDDKLYVCDGHRGLYVLDVSEPTTPVKTGFYPTPIGVHVVRIPSASKAYLAAYDFYAIEINDPENPTVYSIYETEDEVAGLDISGNLAYLCHDRLRDLMILNIGDPASPTLVGIYEPETQEMASAENSDLLAGLLRAEDDDTTKVYKYPESTLPKADVRGNKAIVTGLTSGSLEMLDVGDPSSPTRHSYYPMPGFVGDIDIQGNTAYVCNGTSGVHILNINDVAKPELIGDFEEPWALSFHLSDIAAQIGDGGEGIWLVDLSEPSSPALISRFLSPGPTHGVDENGHLAYTASGLQGLHVINIHETTSPTITGHFDSEGYAIDVRYHGGLIYLADKYTGLWILRYTGPHPLDGGNGGNETAVDRRWRLFR